MKIVSVNIGEPQTIQCRGKEVKTGIYKYPVEGPIFLEPRDVKNDHVIDRRYHGGTDKACYSYSFDHYNFWQKLYPEVDFHPGIFGENLTIEGLNEAEVFIGDVFQIGYSQVQVTQPRQPCYKLGVRFGTQKMIKQFVDSGFSGVYFRILKQGQVKAGDEVILVKQQNALSIQKIFELLYTDNFQKHEVKKAVNDPNLAESCRIDLIKRWEDYLK